MRSARFAGLLVALAGCGSPIDLTLDPPRGTRSALVVTPLEPAGIRVHAYDFEGMLEPFEFEGRDDDEVFALYYEASLAQLGIDPGRQSDLVEGRPAPTPDAAAVTTIASGRWVSADEEEASRGVEVPRIESAECSARGGCWVVDRCAFECDITEPDPPRPPDLPRHPAFVATATVNVCGEVVEAPRAEVAACPSGRRTWDGSCVESGPCPVGPYADGAFDHFADDDTTLQVALAAASDGETIALAKGTYGAISTDRRVSIVGACASETIVGAVRGQGHAIELLRGGEVRGLTVDTPDLEGAALISTGPFAGRDLVVRGDIAAVRLNGSGPVRLEDSEISAETVGVITDTSSATVDGVTIRAFRGLRCASGGVVARELLVADADEGVWVQSGCVADLARLHTSTSSVGVWVEGRAAIDDLRAEGGQGFFFARESLGGARGVTFTGRNLGYSAGQGIVLADLVGHVSGRGVTMFRNGVGSVARVYLDGTGIFALDLDAGRWMADSLCAVGLDGTPVVRVNGVVFALSRLAIHDTRKNNAIELLNDAQVGTLTDVLIDGVPQGGLLLGPRTGVHVQRLHIRRPTAGEVPSSEDGLYPTFIDVDVGSSEGLTPPTFEDVVLESAESDPLFVGMHVRVSTNPPTMRRFRMDLPFSAAVRVSHGGGGVTLEEGTITSSDLAIGCTVTESEVTLDRVRIASGVVFDDRVCLPIRP